MTDSAKTPRYIMAFLEAVYPDAPHLALASFNERKCIEDATETIMWLRAELVREQARDIAPDNLADGTF